VSRDVARQITPTIKIDAKSTEERMATGPRHTDTHETTHEATRKTAEQASQAARTMADTGERVARASAETMRASAETMHQTSEAMGDAWREGAETASRLAERSLDRFSKMFGLGGETAKQAVERSSGNLRAMMASGTVVAGGLQGLSGEFVRFLQDRFERNFDHYEQLLECRSINECVALQMQIVRDNVEGCLETARRTSQLSTHMADEAVRRMSDPSLIPA
jgi:hypothetical protein